MTARKSTASAGFGRCLRLLDGPAFATVFERKRRLHGARFNTHVASNALGHARIGLAVSKRVSKRAVERNRIKRMIRESFRCHRRDLGAIDYVVIAKPGAAEQPSPTLRAELNGVWAKAAQKCK